ncbi:protein kinase domain-containing protein [[Limnothrix rosea] IAM M-220]|uniref:protein kinase domain-containing protein n=1 Tax=[Limnothrix rosea] IAM M-220 TaxID=454133 RepID=UPI000963DDC4|nr:protein kinase [[Limnothrix rosea] IAM M-220]OKH14655.1 hypothetical protein NIES208_13440 [[Limnothrix rosea] IAM M-220]
MTSGTPCYCINPNCSDRQNYFGFQQKDCRACGTPLVVQPHNLLLREPLYGFMEEGTNSEIFAVESLGFSGSDYPQLIKILRPNTGAIAARLFQQEGELLQQLRGYAVPRVQAQPYFQVPLSSAHGQPRHRDLHCLLMEKIAGQSLDHVIQQGLISTAQAIDWLRQLAQLLFTIHRHNIIHRDIKPANLVVREKAGFPYGELVLIDFGTARRSTPTYVEKVAGDRAMTRIVSAGYAAPEQCAGKYTFKSDLFAAGRTIMHLMTGIHPAAEDYDTLNWQELVPQKALRQLLLRLTQPQPHQRLKSAAALRDEMSRLLKIIDAHPVRAWLSLHQRHLKKNMAIACGFALMIPLGFRAHMMWRSPSKLRDTAAEAYRAKDYERALRFFSLLKRKNNEDYNALATHGMARSLEALAHDEAAIEKYQTAIVLGNPQNDVSCLAATDLGHLFLQQGKLTEGATYLTQGLNCSSHTKTKAAALRNLAALYHQTGQVDEAQKHLLDSLELINDHPTGVCLQTLFNGQQSTTVKTKSAIDCLS